MARIRTIKPELPQSESMGRISRDARLCFIMLWTLVDDDGRARGNSRMLASLLYPYDDDAGSLMDGWLKELEGEDCIVRYRVDGDSYVEIKNWRKHQKIDHPTASRLPAPPNIANPREPSRTLAPDLVPVPVPVPVPSTKTSTKDQGPARETEGFAEFWEAYPLRKNRAKALKAFATAAGKADTEMIIRGARVYSAQEQRKGTEARYLAHAATWLNQERWTDEPDPLTGREAALAVLEKIAPGEFQQ